MARRDSHRWFAACAPGLEPILEQELRDLGVERPQARGGGVAFDGDRRQGYAANLWLRTAIRVQEVLLRAPVRDGEDLHAAAVTVPWKRFILPSQSLAVRADVRDTPGLRHSGYVAQRIKDAVVDVVRTRRGERPSVDTRQPDLPLHAWIRRGHLVLSRNLSGRSLHKRGWRPIQVRSPLNEATAAALLLHAGWRGEAPLVDPMCGSGTFPVEAAWIAQHRAPGLDRRFAFEAWPDHDPRLWDALRKEAWGRIRPTPGVSIEGADHHPGALALARRGVEAAGVADVVRLSKASVERFRPRLPGGWAVVNPPYGLRLGEGESLRETWYQLGQFFRAAVPGGEAWVLSGNPEMTRHLQLRATARLAVQNGSLACRWLGYGIRAADASKTDPSRSGPSERPMPGA